LYFFSVEQGIKHSEQNAFYDGSCPIDVSREEDIKKYIDASKYDRIYEEAHNEFCLGHFNFI
jgi:hypothetical protein